MTTAVINSSLFQWNTSKLKQANKEANFFEKSMSEKFTYLAYAEVNSVIQDNLSETEKNV